MELKYCVNCAWSKEISEPYPKLRCTHPKVNSTDPWELSAINIRGRECVDERKDTRWFFRSCGMAGRLYEDKNVLVEPAIICYN